MKTKILTGPFFAAVLLFTLGFSDDKSTNTVPDSDMQSVLYELVVKQIDDEWRVVHPDDDTKSDITVKRGDRVRWTIEGSDASFQFMDEKLTGRSTRTVRDGRQLNLAIGAEAAHGINPYSVFMHADLEFARGQSPPRIIVEAQ